MHADATRTMNDLDEFYPRLHDNHIVSLHHWTLLVG